MNKKGQALVEFVIILPVFLCIMLSMIDFGIIIYNKNKMENKINDVVNMISDNKTTDEINRYIRDDNKNTTYEVIESEKYKTIKLYSQVDIITPGLNIVLNSPYKIEVKRVVYDK